MPFFVTVVWFCGMNPTGIFILLISRVISCPSVFLVARACDFYLEGDLNHCLNYWPRRLWRYSKSSIKSRPTRFFWRCNCSLAQPHGYLKTAYRYCLEIISNFIEVSQIRTGNRLLIINYSNFSSSFETLMLSPL